MMGGGSCAPSPRTSPRPWWAMPRARAATWSDTSRARGPPSIASAAPARREKLWKAIDAAEIPQDPRFATDAAVAENMKALNEAIERKLSNPDGGGMGEILNPGRRGGDGGAAAHPCSPPPATGTPPFFHAFEDNRASGLPPFAVPTSPIACQRAGNDPFHAAAPGAAYRRGAGRARVLTGRDCGAARGEHRLAGIAAALFRMSIAGRSCVNRPLRGRCRHVHLSHHAAETCSTASPCAAAALLMSLFAIPLGSGAFEIGC